MRLQSEKYFKTTVLAISILVLALWSEKTKAGGTERSDIFNSLPDICKETMLNSVGSIGVTTIFFLTGYKKNTIKVNDMSIFHGNNVKYDFYKKLLQYHISDNLRRVIKPNI